MGWEPHPDLWDAQSTRWHSGEQYSTNNPLALHLLQERLAGLPHLLQAPAALDVEEVEDEDGEEDWGKGDLTVGGFANLEPTGGVGLTD